MSDLTPDGDQTKFGAIAIRSFPFSQLPDLNDAELALMRDWADACEDDLNQARLERLMGVFTGRA